MLHFLRGWVTKKCQCQFCLLKGEKCSKIMWSNIYDKSSPTQMWRLYKMGRKSTQENSVILKPCFVLLGWAVNKKGFLEAHWSPQAVEGPSLWLVPHREGHLPNVTPVSVPAASPVAPPARKSRVPPLPHLKGSPWWWLESTSLRIYWPTLKI